MKPNLERKLRRPLGKMRAFCRRLRDVWPLSIFLPRRHWRRKMRFRIVIIPSLCWSMTITSGRKKWFIPVPNFLTTYFFFVKRSTFVPDIVMIDLTQDSPTPARIPTKVFPKSSLKEVKPVANVQPTLPPQKVKVETSPHPLPTKERHDRPSVSFALPIQPQRYPWTETSTPARKQRTDLGVFKT